MIARLSEIKAQAPEVSIETMYIVADFTKLLTMDAYRDTIESKLRNVDVSILILNAGMGEPGPFEKVSENGVSNLLTCNIMHASYLPKLLANQLLGRKA